MRRKQGNLIPLELSIIEAAVCLDKQGVKEFHGFQIGKELKNSHQVTNGALYRALQRLEQWKFLVSHWESRIPAGQHRPRRRYYCLTKKALDITPK